jgi:hypothetical protein
MEKSIFGFLGIIFFLSSCNKEYKAGKTLAKKWDVAIVERSYFTNNVLDSSRSLTNVATVEFTQIKDAVTYSNKVEYTKSNSMFHPYFIEYEMEYWLPITGLNKRIVFSGGAGEIAYTTLKYKKRQIIIQTLTLSSNGNFNVKEVVTLNAK